MLVELVAVIEPHPKGNRIRGCFPRARTARPTVQKAHHNQEISPRDLA